jgi:hypothetical protein
MLHFNVVFTSKDMSFNVDMKNENKSFTFGFDNIQTVTKEAEYEYYEESYSVTPKATSQVLETKSKLMKDDLTINKIPFFETSNEQGGNTIYIGDEI